MHRFIPFQRYDPYFKTGLNKALIESVQNTGRPILFLAGWNQKCINLGYSQSFSEEVDVEEFNARNDVVLVRRQGGGGATFLTPDGEITWGIVAPEEEFPADVNKIYREVCQQIAEGLEKIGITAEHEPVNDIVTSKGKISGSTLKKENGVVYIGGTLLYKTDLKEMFSLLTPSEEKKKDKQIETYSQRISSVKRESNASFEETKDALKNALLKDKDFEISQLKDQELRRAENLADKYSDEEWLYKE